MVLSKSLINGTIAIYSWTGKKHCPPHHSLLIRITFPPEGILANLYLIMSQSANKSEKATSALLCGMRSDREDGCAVKMASLRSNKVFVLSQWKGPQDHFKYLIEKKKKTLEISSESVSPSVVSDSL